VIKRYSKTKMLHQEICWHCVLKVQNAGYNDEEGIKSYKKTFDDTWKRGYVHCGIMMYILEVNREPPSNCSFTLEHVVNDG
jgi:hypothetical protein